MSIHAEQAGEDPQDRIGPRPAFGHDSASGQGSFMPTQPVLVKDAATGTLPGILDVVVLAARSGRSSGMVVVLLRRPNTEPEGASSPPVRAWRVGFGSAEEVDPSGMPASDFTALLPAKGDGPAVLSLPSSALVTLGPAAGDVPWSSAVLKVRLHEARADATVRVASGPPSMGRSGPDVASVSAGA